MSLPKSIDIVIATYNRSALLQRTLASIAKAVRPANLAVGVIVVDNNSTDDTRSVVDAWTRRLDVKLSYLSETKQGRSPALNTGIRSSKADLIGMIDDDEEIDENWLVEIASQFLEPSLDFLGGPCIPNWGALTAPTWLPKSHGGLIGWIVPAESDFDYAPSNPAYMVGGNAVVRRQLFDRVGLYHVGLGRTGTNANGGEDLEFFGRLMAAGAKGRYASNLVIFHHIPIERLDRGFFRKRSFWDGVSIGFVSRTQPEPVPHIVGIPRYFIRMAATGALQQLSFRTHAQAERFAGQLRLVELFGRAYGRYLYVAR
jgi:glycosyltransferase involved in cell wall biosynthesis